jgi:hypothetical protein
MIRTIEFRDSESGTIAKKALSYIPRVSEIIVFDDSCYTVTNVVYDYTFNSGIAVYLSPIQGFQT